MFPIRIKACSESDLRMLGNLARNIQRVLPVTQADIDAAAALGKGWVVWKVIEVNDPIDNLRGGTQLVIKQNSITPGQNVRRVLIVSGPGGETVVIGPGSSPLLLPDAIADSLTYVKAFGGTIQKTLPDGYTELEYIESDGNQYIDLGLKLTQDDSAEIEFELTTSQATKYVFGARISDANNNNISLFFASTTNKIVVDFNNSDYSAYRAGPTSLTTGVKYKALLRKDDRGVYDGSTTVVENLTACADNIETAGNAILFNGFYNAGALSVSYGFTGRVYSCKLANKRNLIPCKNPNNVVGMYDTVSGQFFTNVGTGNFVAGPQTNYGVPSDYKALEYITFTGTQYLDTLITSYSNDNVLKVKLNPSEINNYPVSLQYPTSGTNDLGFYMGSSRWYFKYGAPSLSALASANTDYTIEATNGRLKINGVTQTGTVSTTITMSDPVYIGAGVKGGSVNSRKFQGKIYYFRIEDSNGNVLFNGVPVKHIATSLSGMYDTVSGHFLTNKGTGTISAGPVVGGPNPSSPQPICCNNGVLKLGYTSRNLNVGTLDNQGYTSTGGTSTSTTFCGTLWKIKVQEGEKYTISFGNFPDGISGVFINTWKTDGTWNLRQAISISGDYTYTIPAGVGEVNFTLYKTGGITIGSNSWLQVEKGETATPYVPAGYGLYVDGTTETINVHSTNIFNKNDTENIGNWYCSSSSKIASAGSNQTLVMRAKPGATYYFKHCSVTGGGRAFYTEVEDWAVGSDCSAMSGTTTIDKDEVKSITVSENAKWVFFIYGRSGQTATFEEQLADFMVSLTPLTSDTQYTPYYDGGTATAEMLLKVGDYQDEQEILSGVVTRKVGIKVLDGTENWQNLSNYYNISKTDLGTNSTVLPSASLDIMCTHYKVVTSAAPDGCMSVGGSYINFRNYSAATLTDWTNWLAAQYAAGTPVILIYPLATETTESVTGQTLQVTSGDNVVEITQASLSGLELEAEYTKVA